MAAVSDDLSAHVDVKGVQILNAEETVNVFNGNSVLRSDCDAQLLITVPLREAVKLSGIAFRAASDGPKTVRVFVNQPNLDFAEAESTKPNVEIVLKADDLKGVVKELKMVKFQNCTSVTFYIVDNQTDADKTNVSRISLFGSVQAGTDMKQFKAVG